MEAGNIWKLSFNLKKLKNIQKVCKINIPDIFVIFLNVEKWLHMATFLSH